ncbi:MAG: hypothetical protein Q4P15_13245 [Propionibacteriaceae bacterium]|nr:hypothetical protein [Propionibacteriaceae bacterium]
MSNRVRPTKRALNDLGLDFPHLTLPLDQVPHRLVQHAQRVPDEVDAGGAERIRDIDDRVWFKVKSGTSRGAAGRVKTPDEITEDQVDGLPAKAWWLVAAGSRQADTAAGDFYSRISAECRRAGAGTGRISTDVLLPTAVDYRRWIAERATLVVEALKHTVREAIARSAQCGDLHVAEARGHRIGALVQSRDGDTYLAVTAEGYVDHKILAIILSAVPNVAVDDWMAEPGPVLGIEPNQGQFVFSTMLPPAALSAILEEIDDHFL